MGVAVNAVPTCGAVELKLTAPASSALVTLMVTVMLAVSLDGSVAVTVTS